MATSGPIRVFISYRRDDTAGHAGRLYDSLVARLGSGGHVFMDVDDIEPGVDFTEVLHDAVSSCDVMLALIGPRWSVAAALDGSRRLDDPADYLVNEIGTALERNVRVIPILVDGAAMPATPELPDRLKSLGRRNAMWLRTTTWRPDAESIFEVLDHIRTPPAAAVTEPSSVPLAPTVPVATPPPVMPPPSAEPPRSKKPLWIALAALAAVIVVIGVVVSMSGSDSSTDSGSPTVNSGVGGEGFKFAPTSGPITTDIRLVSVAPCPELEGWTDELVEVVVFDPRQYEETLDGYNNSAELDLKDDRSWEGEVDMVEGATEGTLELRVACVGTDPDGNRNPFYEYDAGSFELTSG